MSRPRRIHLVTALLVAVAACGGGSASTTTTTLAPTTTTSTSTTTTTSTTTSTTTTTMAIPPNDYGGEVVVGVEIEPDILNPFLPGGGAEAVARIGATYWTGVQRLDGDTLRLAPDVVEELPTVDNGGIVINEDGTMTVRYTVAENRVWADGTPITAADFLFTYQVITNPGYVLDRRLYEDIDPATITAEDRVFEFTMRRPTLAVQLMFNVLLPAHNVRGRDFLRHFDNTPWMSGGPFVFEEWVRGDHLSVVRNPEYNVFDPVTGQQLPYLDRIVFRFLPGNAALLDAFLAREVDIVAISDDLGGIARLMEATNEGADVQVIRSGTWESLNFQFGENRLSINGSSYNEHIEFRRAVAHAIDKQRLVDEVLDGRVPPLDSYVDAYLPWMSGSAWSQYDYDPDEARNQIDLLCAKDGVDCGARPPRAVLKIGPGSDRLQTAQLIAVMLGAAGIRTDIRTDSAAVFFGDTLEYGRFDLSEWGWEGAPLPTKLVVFHDAFDPAEVPAPVGINFTRWGAQAVDFPPGSPFDGTPYEQAESSVANNGTSNYGLVNRGLHSTIEEERLAELVAQAEGILADQLAFIPLYQLPRAGAVWADVIAGYRVVPAGDGLPFAVDTWNAATWHRLDL